MSDSRNDSNSNDDGATMDRAYQISVDETTIFNLAAFNLDTPPDRTGPRGCQR